MDPKMIAKQIINLDRNAFEGMFNAINSLQTFSEKIIDIYLGKTNLLSPEAKKAMKELMIKYEDNKRDFKESVDNNFKNMEHFLVVYADAANFSSYGSMKETAQSKQETISDFKESIQPKAAKMERAGKQKSSVPKMVEESEIHDYGPHSNMAENINVSLKTVSTRKTVKTGKNKK